MSAADLAVLRVSLATAQSGQVSYELEVAGATSSEEALYQHPTSQFNMANWLLPDRATDDHFKFELPEELPQRIKVSVDALLEEDRPLWLHLVEPYGYLGLVPWERMLVPALKRPVLRLPEVSSRRSSGRRLDVVLCVNPPAKEILRPKKALSSSILQRASMAAANVVGWVGGFVSLRSALGPLVEAIDGGSPVPLQLHVFASNKWRLVLAGLADRLGWGRDRIIFYHVESDTEDSALELSEGEDQTADGVHNPWLRLILDRIGLRVDAIHFVSHGGVAFNRGALTFGTVEGMPKGSWSSVSPMEMSIFLAQLGPSVVGFSTPPDDPAEAGMRYFADGLARLRPNPVFFHEMKADPDATTVRDAYELLFGDEQSAAPQLENGFVYCDPSYVREEPDLDVISDMFTTMQAEPDYLTDESPRWAMALQSYLDRRRMLLREWDLASAESVAAGAATDLEELEGIKETLDMVSEIMGDYLSGQDEGVDS